MNCASKVLQLLAAISLFALANPTRAVDISNQMWLTEAIEAVQAQGFEVIYSSKLVKPWMRVRNKPSKNEPLAALDEVLAAHALALAPGPNGRWLIVTAESAPWSLLGQVVDATTNAPLSRVQVRLAGLSTTTNAAGEFEFANISGAHHRLRLRAPGYELLERNVANASSDAVLTIALQPLAAPALEEIEIVGSQYTLFDQHALSDQFMSGEEIRLLPHIADDVYRAFHRLPGVAASDFSAPFNLRGGTVEEVKVMLDGLELFEPFHMRNLFSPLSIIDPGIIGQAQVLSGGLTAEYGNHMSGVIDISSRHPDSGTEHEVGVSFVTAFARSQGRFANGRGTYLISGRRGYLDLIAEQITAPNEELTPRYSDIFAKTTYAVNDSVEMSANVLSATDDVRLRDIADGEDFGGDSSLNYAWLSIDADWTDRLSNRSLMFIGDVDITADGMQDNVPEEDITRLDSRDIDIIGLQSDFSLLIGDSHALKWGARFRHLEARYDYRLDATRWSEFVNNGAPFVTRRAIKTDREGDEWGVYLAHRFQPIKGLVWELGLRWDKQTYTDTDDETQISPRLNALYSLNDNTAVRVAWGRFYQPQGIQDLQVQDGVTEYFPAERVQHRVLGLTQRFSADFELRVDLYDKRYRNLRPRFENVLDIQEFAAESNFDRVRIEAQSARAKGVEITVRQHRPKGLDWWVNYTWSTVKDDINGMTVPRTWDQRHAVTANLTWQGKRWSVSAVGRYHSGWPSTPLLVDPILDDAGLIVGIDADISQRNTERFEEYSRLDLRFSRRIPTTHGELRLFLEIFNVFDSENECCVENHQLSIGSGVSATPSVEDYLPLFPSFGFTWTFGSYADGAAEL